jgi:hypothetical protein
MEATWKEIIGGPHVDCEGAVVVMEDELDVLDEEEDIVVVLEEELVVSERLDEELEEFVEVVIAGFAKS